MSSNSVCRFIFCCMQVCSVPSKKPLDEIISNCQCKYQSTFQPSPVCLKPRLKQSKYLEGFEVNYSCLKLFQYVAKVTSDLELKCAFQCDIT